MKKRIRRTIIIATLLTAILAIPVMAQEVTDPTKVYTVKSFDADENILINDFHKGEVWRCENYLEYLDGVIYNLNETVRIKREVVTNYKELAKYNPYYASLIPAAERDLAQAVAWVDAYKAYRKDASIYLKAQYKY